MSKRITPKIRSVETIITRIERKTAERARQSERAERRQGKSLTLSMLTRIER